MAQPVSTAASAREAGSAGPAVLLTFATLSWQKGSAAQVASLVHELRKVRPDLRLRLLSHCPDIDVAPARRLGVEIVDPGFPARASRNRRSLSLLARRVRCVAAGLIRRRMPLRRGRPGDPVDEAYAGTDLILDLSGDSYRDPPGGFALAHHANFLAAEANGIPYALVSQSLGPFRRWNEPLVRHCLRRAALVYIREGRTRDMLVRLGVPAESLQLCPDIAFALPATSAGEIWTASGLNPERIERPWVALSVSQLARRIADVSPDGANRYLEEMAKLSQHVRQRYGASVLLVPHEANPPYYGPDDRDAAQALYERAGRPDWMQPIRGDHSPSSLKGLIGRCDALVASRMHAGIAGLSSAVPTLLVAWSHKYSGLMEEIGIEHCVWDQTGSSDVSLSALFDRLWERRAPLRARLRAYAAEARQKIAEMACRIVACIPNPPVLDPGRSAHREARIH